MSTILIAVTCAAAASVGAWLAHRRRGAEGEGEPKQLPERKDRPATVGKAKPAELEGDEPSPAPPKKKRPPAEAEPAPRALPKRARPPIVNPKVTLSDVVSHDGAERWLAGQLTVHVDGTARIAVFFAPEGKETAVVVAFSPPRRELLWLLPVDYPAAGEPPTTIELGRTILTRRSRVPAKISTHGDVVTDLGEEVMVAEYEGPGGDAALLLIGKSETRAYLGTRIDGESVDVWGSGRDPVDRHES